jgi:hypothetical protein
MLVIYYRNFSRIASLKVARNSPGRANDLATRATFFVLADGCTLIAAGAGALGTLDANTTK